MANYKAIVGLSRGRVAYFDPLSNIMLDLSKPADYVYDHMDVSGLKSAIGGSIYLISGSLADEPVAAIVNDNKTEEPAETVEEAVDAEVKVEEAESTAEPVKKAASARKKTASK